MTSAPTVGWRLAAAGSLSGAFTNTLLHPLDTVKTVRQTNPGSFRGIFPTMFSILRTRGPAGLYLGIIPTLAGSSVSTALYFGMYELAKQKLSSNFPRAWQKRRTRVPMTAVSAACGNVASSIVFVPKEVVKQRLQYSGQKGMYITVGRTVHELFTKGGGIPAFYRGYKATLLRNIPSAMIRFAAYEELKMIIKRIAEKGNKNNNNKLEAHHLVLAGSMAGALSSACTTPMDVVKTRLATGIIAPGTSLPSAFSTIIKRDGVPGLFVGIRPRMLWSALFAAVGFTSYEICKALLTGMPYPFPLPLLGQSSNMHKTIGPFEGYAFNAEAKTVVTASTQLYFPREGGLI